MSLTDIVSHANVTIFAEIALLIFAVTFGAIIIHTWRRPRADIARLSTMALDGDKPDAIAGRITPRNPGDSE